MAKRMKNIGELRGSLWRAFWPPVMTLQEAHSASRQAFWAALIIGCGSTLIGLIAVSFPPAVAAAPFEVDATIFIDASLMLLCAIGLFFHSRAAAVIALALYTLGRIMLLPYSLKNPVFLIIFIMLFVNGVRGTFAYQRLRREQQHSL